MLTHLRRLRSLLLSDNSRPDQAATFDNLAGMPELACLGISEEPCHVYSAPSAGTAALQLPPEASRLQSLTALDLSRTGNDCLPEGFGALTALTQLNLERNRFTEVWHVQRASACA